MEIFMFDHTYDTIFVQSMVNGGFMMNNDEISIMAKDLPILLAIYEAFFLWKFPKYTDL